MPLSSGPAGVIPKEPSPVRSGHSSAGYTGINSAGWGFQIKSAKHVADCKTIFRFKQIKEMQLETVEDSLKDTWGGGFSGGSALKPPRCQCRGPGFHLWSRRQISQATARISHVATKDMQCSN